MKSEVKKKQIKWTEKNGDYTSDCGWFDIENAGAVWWAYHRDKPIGTYRSVEEAKHRCQTVKDEK